MRYLLLFSAFLYCQFSMAQEVISPLKYNPYQNSTHQIREENDKSTLVRDDLIFQFDTLKLPFKDDFSANHFPSQTADISNAAKITIHLLLRNGNPVGQSEVFSTDTSFRYTVYPANDSLSAAIPNPSEVISYVDFSVFPFKLIDTTVWPAYTLFDTLGRANDTVYFTEIDLVQEKITKYLLPPDSTIFWMDHFVYKNNDFPIDPPSIGVATFDGLDEDGMPYDFNAQVSGNADKMTSVPIDISSLAAKDSLYLSFYYQAQGISPDNPNNGDSLMLDFFNIDSNRWVNVWGIDGGQNVKAFEEVFVLVDSIFYSNAFRFRFRNRANLSGDFDQWHVDYIYLNKNRSRFDTTKKDVAFIYQAPSFIKDYTSMPWFHYKITPSEFTKDYVEVCFKNRFHQSLNVFYALQVINKRDSFQYYRFPTSTAKFAIVNGYTTRCQDFSVESDDSNFSSLLRINDFSEEESIETKYSVDFRPSQNEIQDFMPSNDTLRKVQLFSNFYSYDDGTAEAGYGVENFPGNEMLIHFKMPVNDSLIALKIYFLPQAYDISKQRFKIVIYNSLGSNGLLYTSSQEFQPVYNENNEFALYILDSLVAVNKDFYVGIKGLGNKSLNIGYDLNLANKSQIFRRYTDNDPFNNPSQAVPEGSLMIRPVFRKLKVNVGVKEHLNPLNKVLLYPNPTKGGIHIKNLPIDSKIKIFNTLGELISSSDAKNFINLDGIKAGIYFVVFSSKDGQYSINKKIILNPR